MRTSIACLTLAAASLAGVVTLAAEPDVKEVPEAVEPDAAKVKDESESTEKFLRLYGEATVWFAQPVGLDYVYATETDPGSVTGTRTRNLDFGTTSRTRWRVGGVVKGDIGSFVMTYWGAGIKQPLVATSPGNFLFGETLAYPLFAGFYNDGTADGVSVRSETATRDLRLDFLREAFRSNRMSAKWLAGIRLVDHNENIAATYYALIPNIPPIIDGEGGQPDRLSPSSDVASRRSRFSGRGIETGFEAEYKVVPSLHLEGSFIYALLRGKSSASYVSTTHYYAYTEPGSETAILVPPELYEFYFGDSTNYNGLNQFPFRIGVQDAGSSTSSSVLEAHLGFRWKAWRDLVVLGGVRQSRYQDAALEVRPRDVTVSFDGTPNFLSLDKKYKSVGYEGFYLGLAYTY